jgi:invasion protein IalB
LQVLSQKNIEQQQRDTAATRKLEARAQLDRVLARIAVPLSLSLSPLSPLSLSSLSHTSLSLI